MSTSIIMATYNGEKVISEQLFSILKQKDIPDEVVICDDKSTDQTVTIIREFIKKNKLSETWHLYENDKNLGYRENFKKACYLASGDLIFFSDQDDIWKTDKTKVMSTLIRENPQIEMLAAQYIPFSKNKSMNFNDSESHSQEDYQVERISISEKNMYLRSVGCTMAVKKSFLEKIQPYWYEDWAQDEVVWKLSLCRKSGYTTNYKAIYRRFHEDNTSGQKNHDISRRLQYLRNLEKSYQTMYRFAKKNQMDTSSIKIIKKAESMARKRQQVLKQQDIKAATILLFQGLGTYYRKRAWLVEFFLGFIKRYEK